jgi:hypothetical protein
MDRKLTAISILLLLVLLLGAWWFISHGSFRQTRSSFAESLPSAQNSAPLTVTHHKSGKTHTYQGSLDISSCDTVQTRVENSGGDEPQLELDFTAINDAACTSGSYTPIPFSIATDASAQPRLESITLNGKQLSFNVIDTP